MRVLVFTSNQPRHAALVRTLQAHHHDLTVIVEPKTFGPFDATGVPARYWAAVRRAEQDIFPQGAGMTGVHDLLCVLPGDINHLTSRLVPMIAWAERVVVFSASYLTGPLLDALIRADALNLHVGIAPEYRGSAPNAWAFYDGNVHLIGAQVQRLSRGLDAGDILAEAYSLDSGYFERSMRAVRFGIEALIRVLGRPAPWYPMRANDRAKQIRYARHCEFSDDVARRILETTDG